MKKYCLMLSAALLAASTLCAQQKPGTFSITPKVGITVSNFSGKTPVTAAYAIASAIDPTGGLAPVTPDNLPKVGAIMFNDNKSKVGFTVGAEAQYQFTDVFGLSVGAFFTQQGAKYDTKGFTTEDNGVRVSFADDLKLQLNSVTIPVLANAYVWKGLAVKAGLQPEFAVSKKVKGDMTVSYQGQTATTALGDADNLRTFSLSLPVGISYEYKNIVADFRYSIGLTDQSKNGDTYAGSNSSSSVRNSTFALTLGYKFPL